MYSWISYMDVFHHIKVGKLKNHFHARILMGNSLLTEFCWSLWVMWRNSAPFRGERGQQLGLDVCHE